ncbi:MAG: hypothetical protein LC101_03460 [Flavobacteriales bacterium]|nr:hypothetical protein [Flavobacteriales bacterium]
MKHVHFFASALIILSACGKPKMVTFEHEFTNVPLQISAPVPQGPNTFQIEIPLDLDDLFASHQADRKKINEVHITSLDFSMQNERNFNNFETFVINFFSDSQDMTKLASISPVPKGSTALSVQVTEKAELQKFFADPTLFVILDANITELDTVGYNLMMNMKVNFTAAEAKK